MRNLTKIFYASAVLPIGVLVPARAKEQNRQRADKMKRKQKTSPTAQ